MTLVAADEGAPAVVRNPGGASPFLLIGDHAGRAIPRVLGDLGLPPAELDRHIAWDIGVAGVGAHLSRRLDACFIGQRYSRLVIDCNRDPSRPDSIPAASDGAEIGGNAGLSDEARALRRDAIFSPYHQRIAGELDARAAAGRGSVLVALHSFTPVMAGIARPWRFGVLHQGDSAFSRAVLRRLRRDLGDEVGDNEPYAMDGIDFTIPHHAGGRGLDYLELEIRQDLIADDAGQEAVAKRLAPLLAAVLEDGE